jgi:hypothetical protein
MDTLVSVYPVKTKVLIELPEGEFSGEVTGSGYQSQELKYFVLLDDPTGFPNLPPGELVAVVPTDIVKIDAKRMFQ